MRHRIMFFGLGILVLAAVSVIANAQGTVNTPGALIQRKVYPPYPYEARSNGLTGSGVVSLKVGPRTGYVTSARMLKSTGHQILDEAALEAHRQWRFKPGTVSYIRIPITFTMRGVRY